METHDMPPGLPRGFLFGVATAAYQIEGAVAEDGRGPSIWDTFSGQPGNIAGGDTGAVACDHYHRYHEDIELMRRLGVDAYRFSVSWSRIQPEGSGPVNQPGLDFYRRLVDALLRAGVTPCITLHHFDLPQALEDAGGWRVRDTAERFAEYASLVHEALADRVPMWITLNEPRVSAFDGYATGEFAPGVRAGGDALAAVHHLLVGHGLAVRAMRSQRRGDERFGITLDLDRVTPASDDPADVAAGRRARLVASRAFTDPILARRWPADERAVWGAICDFSFRRDGDELLAGTPVDFLGVNYYFPHYAKHAPTADPDPRRRTAAEVDVVYNPPRELPRTAMGWPVEPAGLTRLLSWLRDEYPDLPPVYVTENGAAYRDILRDGQVDDPDRIGYLDGHLRAVRAAIDAGVDVRGYFCWSLLDNFEWADGYGKRFGLVYVDYPTQRRVPKSSYHWYRKVIESNKAEPYNRSPR